MSFPALIVVPTANAEAAKATYSALLGIEPYADSPYYIGYRTDRGEIGIDPSNPGGGPIPYWDVADLDAAIGSLTATGATIVKAPQEVGGGLSIAVLADSDGNPVGLRQGAS